MEERSQRGQEGEKGEKDEREAQILVGRFQGLQQQLQSVLVQKESLRLQAIEIDGAIKELDGADKLDKTGRAGPAKGSFAYKITGSVMVKKPVAELRKELKESREAIDVRLKSLEKSEVALNSQLQELNDKLRKFVR